MELCDCKPEHARPCADRSDCRISHLLTSSRQEMLGRGASRPKPEPVPVPNDAPEGAYAAYRTASGKIAILGNPDPDGKDHNCDAMGCRSEHVIEWR